MAKSKKPIINVKQPATPKKSQPRNESHSFSSSNIGVLKPKKIIQKTRSIDAVGENGQKAQFKKPSRHNGSFSKDSGLKSPSKILQQAADAIKALIEADETKKRGASLKTLTLAPHIVAKKATFAVTCQVLKNLSLLKEIESRSRITETNPKLSRFLAYVLIYEVLFGQGLGGRLKGPAERCVLKLKPQIDVVVKTLCRERKVPSLAALAAAMLHGGASAAAAVAATAAAARPRWARVNLLKTTVDEARHLLAHPPPEWGANITPIPFAESTPDQLIPELLRLPPVSHASHIHADHPAVASGLIVLQGRASCLPVAALNPPPHSVVLDCCAAPGNKTTMAAGRVGPKGHVIAFDRDPKRLELLKANAKRVGAEKVIEARVQDFLQVDPEEFGSVQSIVLDPSCSGTGTTGTRMDFLLPSFGKGRETGKGKRKRDEEEEGEKEVQMERVKQLAAFQKLALLHTFRFPNVQRISYSTCSIHREENEDVVAAVLPIARENGFELKDPFPQWKRTKFLDPKPFEGAEKLVRTDEEKDATDGFFVALFVKAKGERADGEEKTREEEQGDEQRGEQGRERGPQDGSQDLGVEQEELGKKKETEKEGRGKIEAVTTTASKRKTK